MTSYRHTITLALFAYALFTTHVHAAENEKKSSANNLKVLVEQVLKNPASKKLLQHAMLINITTQHQYNALTLKSHPHVPILAKTLLQSFAQAYDNPDTTVTHRCIVPADSIKPKYRGQPGTIGTKAEFDCPDIPSLKGCFLIIPYQASISEAPPLLDIFVQVTYPDISSKALEQLLKNSTVPANSQTDQKAYRHTSLEQYERPWVAANMWTNSLFKTQSFFNEGFRPHLMTLFLEHFQQIDELPTTQTVLHHANGITIPQKTFKDLFIPQLDKLYTISNTHPFFKGARLVLQIKPLIKLSDATCYVDITLETCPPTPAKK